MTAPRHKVPKFKLGELLTVGQLAQALHVSIKTVRDWVYKKRIPFTRVERRIYFAAGVVEDLLNKNAVGALRSGRSPGSRPRGRGGVQLEESNHGKT